MLYMFNKKSWWQRLLLGLLLSASIGLFAYRRRSLSRSGVAGAMATGAVTVGMGGWSWGLSLIYFFVSSSLLSHFRSRDKERIATDKFSKGSQRDLWQVLANGGVASVLSLAHGLTRSQGAKELLQAGYTGALATANGDTWATELGVLNTRPPRLITTGKPVTSGTSGGVTLLGTGAAAAGGLSLGLVFWLLQGLGIPLNKFTLHRRGRTLSGHPVRGTGNEGIIAPTADLSAPCAVDDNQKADKSAVGAVNRPLRLGSVVTGTDSINRSLPLIGLLTGLVGSFADSLMGATIQAMYYCPTCEKETERSVHSCGTTTRFLRGIPHFDNDVVNFIATLFGALLGMGLHLSIQFHKKDTHT